MIFYNQEIAVECFEKARSNKKILPLVAQKNYQLIFNEQKIPQIKPNLERSSTILRRSQSTSPPNSNAKAVNSQTVTTTTLPTKIKNPKPEPRNSPGSPVLIKKTVPININVNLSKPIQSETFFKPPTDYKKLKLKALSQRSKNQTSLNSLELKPATVEGNRLL